VPAIAQRPATVEALIVSYNTRDLLRQTIATFEAHRPAGGVADVTVGVLDNASADGSAEMVEAEFPGVRLIRSDANLGFARATNELARTSTASHLLLVNSDVVFVEDVVTPLLEALDDDPLALVAGPRLTFADGRPQTSSEDLPTLGFELACAIRGTKLGALARPLFDADARVARTRQQALAAERTTRRTEFLWATCWLLRRADFESLGLFDERYVTYDEDVDFCRRLQARGRVALYVPSARLVHLGGASSTSAAKEAMMRRGRSRYYRTHHGRMSALANDRGIGLLLAFKRRPRLGRRS
jgi:N-acetylglucosaminyl-diphospho-decaprenol L-rhamnosyltransferase